MPFTPFHWGPTACIGFIFFRFFDFATLLTATTVIDFEPLCVFVFGLDYLPHGVFHSFLGSSLLAVITGVVMYLLKDTVKNVMADFNLQQDSSFKKIVWSSFFGFYFHVLLDALLYKEMHPFYPLKGNPLYGVALWQMYGVCGVLLVAAVLYGFIKSQNTIH